MQRTPRHRPASSSARPLDQEVYELSLEAAEGSAELHVLASMPAIELHRWMASRLGYSPELPYVIQLAPDDTSDDDDRAEPLSGSDPRSLLGGLGLTAGRQLYYDLGEDGWGCSLEVKAVSDRAGDDYPRAPRWELPETVDPTASGELGDVTKLDEDLTALATEIADALEAFDPTDLDDADDDTIPAATLDAQLPLARRLLEATRSRQEQAFLMGDQLGIEMEDWVWALIDELEDSGREAEALALLDESALSRQLFPEVRSRRAQMLIALDRRDEARPLIESLITEGDHPDQRYLAGQALDPLIDLGEFRRAETLAYELRRSSDLYARYDAVDALIKVYQQTGRKPQARKLEREATRLAGEIQRAEARAALDEGDDE